VRLGGDGVLRLHGPVDPLNRTTVDFTSSSARLEFTNETPEAVRKEHLRKITIGGEPAVPGENIRIELLGDTGSVVLIEKGGDA
jgi:hypothetical protein